VNGRIEYGNTDADDGALMKYRGATPLGNSWRMAACLYHWQHPDRLPKLGAINTRRLSPL
jgi:hypothetical protein